jgi:hypothetical protein
MDRDLEDNLGRRFPGLFRELGGDPLRTCMARGCECGDGWHGILARMCERIERHLAARPGSDCWLTQVKEKLGRLRVYADGADEEIKQIIREASLESASTCERCGSRAWTTTAPREGRLSTRCERCRDSESQA